MVSRNFVKKFLFVTGNVEGISCSFTWKALSHGADEKSQPLEWQEG